MKPKFMENTFCNNYDSVQSSQESDFNGFMSPPAERCIILQGAKPIVTKKKKLEIEKNIVTTNSGDEFGGFMNQIMNCSVVLKNTKRFEYETDNLYIENQHAKESTGNDDEIVNSARKCSQTIDQSSIHTFGSEEICDQNDYCRLEMTKFSSNLNFMANNKDLLEISQFSIEPSSTTTEEDTSRKSNIVSSQEENNIRPLSLIEDSCNAVDHKISNSEDCIDKELIKELSFNGKFTVEKTKTPLTKAKAEKSQTESVSEEKKVSSVEKINLQLFQLETSREVINERSPDLFTDDSEEENDDAEYEKDEEEEDKYEVNILGENDIVLIETIVNDDMESYLNFIEKKEKNLMKRMQTLLTGVVPPPSVTNIRYDINDLLSLYRKNSQQINYDFKSETIKENRKPAPPVDAVGLRWPTVLTSYCPGVHYNRTKYTENIELLYLKVTDRHIGQETGTSFTHNHVASPRKKVMKKMYVFKSKI